MAIELATFEQIATILSQLATNYSNIFVDYFDIFYSPDPKNVTLQYYDETGKLNTITIPNRAMDRAYILNGSGQPEGFVSGQAGALYQDLTNGDVYIKQVSASDVNGWQKIICLADLENSISKGAGSPEGVVVRNKGALYIDTNASSMYIKSSSTGNTGWELISIDTSALANTDLSNLTPLGEEHLLKDTTGATNTNSKIFLVGAQEQVAHSTTYSHDTAFVDTAGCLNSSTPTTGDSSTKVATTAFVDGGFVKKTGGTITGVLDFATGNDVFETRQWHTSEAITIGETPSSDFYAGLVTEDSQDKSFANINTSYKTDGTIGANFYVHRDDSGSSVTGTLGVYIAQDGTAPYTKAPTPPLDSNDTNIATTAFCDGNWTFIESNKSRVFSSETGLSLNYASNYLQSLTSYLPNDSNLYELFISARVTPGSTSGNSGYCRLNVAIDGNESSTRYPFWIFLGSAVNRGNADYTEGNTTLVAKRNDKIIISRTDSLNARLDMWMLAYRRVR